MRAISPAARYSIQLFEANVRRGTDASGTVVEYMDSKPVVADFNQGGLLDHEIEVALETFSFSGVPDGVNPLSRISSFDTEVYVLRFPEDQQAAMLKKIDARLRQLQELFPNEFIIVDHPYAERPWELYDEASVDEILLLQKQTGTSPEKVRLYELEHENRREILKAMEKLELKAAGVPEERIVVEA